MRNSRHPFLPLFAAALLAWPLAGQAEDAPPPPMRWQDERTERLEQRMMRQEARREARDEALFDERTERQERHDSWRERRMSPEERNQFRHDIRDAGRKLYPRGRHRGRDE